MKTPNNIRINGVDYEICICDNLNNGGNVIYGEVDYGKTTIYINNTLSEHQHQCITLFHEMTHVLFNNADLELEDDLERVINIVERGFYQILQDNGEKLFDLAETNEGGKQC